MVSSSPSIASDENKDQASIKPSPAEQLGGLSMAERGFGEETAAAATGNGKELKRTQSMPAVDVGATNNSSDVPNGGLIAWLQVFGAFFLTFNSWGITNTFGSYQTYYETTLLSQSTPSAIAWVGSIQAFLMMLVGVLAGPIYDAGYFRALLLVGTFLLVFGHMMLSLCHSFWQVMLAQALCVGIGSGLIYVPSVAILSTYFSTKVGAAIGIAASGSSLGGVIYPIVFHRLLPRIGFGWTTRVLGFIMLGTMMVPNIVMRVRVLPPTTRSLFDPKAFLLPAYTLTAVGFFLGFMGLNMPFFYAQSYAIKQHLTNEDLAFYLLAILNSTSFFGRIIPNILSDIIGPFNAVIPCVMVTATLCILFLTVTSSAGIVILMAFYGFFSGSFVALPSTIIVYISGGKKDKIGARLGQAFSCISIGILIGAPIGGQILDHRGFDALWIYGGCMMFGGVSLVLLARFSWEGLGLRRRKLAAS